MAKKKNVSLMPPSPVPSVQRTEVTLTKSQARLFDQSVAIRNAEVQRLQALANDVSNRCAESVRETINEVLSEENAIKGNYRWEVAKRGKDGSISLVLHHELPTEAGKE